MSARRTSWSRSATLSLALVLLGSCASGASLRLEAETMTTRLDAARNAGAYRCAPAELAQTETELEFLLVEIDQGNAVRADAHRERARVALTQVIDKLKACPSDAPPPADKDKDDDGVLDENDACPEIPGPAKFLGCPDRDGDGLADNVDKCPDAPEDFDEYEDADGCPEEQDRDGDGVQDAQDRCPQVPGPRENAGCPLEDQDRDEILDKNDKCPTDPEDKDQFEDEDGCPDVDNDKDGILDVNDKCRDLPETKNGYVDDDGCPDINPELVVVNRELGKIEIKQKVYFDTGKATIKKVSFQLLNEVAEALRANPSMEVLVEGHTDAVGSDLTNMKLSNARANSVRTYLVQQGIDSTRLTSLGFGETRPISDNDTPDGREANRRVEFTIVKE